MMLTGHTTGVIQLWGNQETEIVPLARLTSQHTACRCVQRAQAGHRLRETEGWGCLLSGS